MILPEYDSSEEEVISSTTESSTMVWSTSSMGTNPSGGEPCIIPEISGKNEDVEFWKGIDFDAWFMFAAICAGLYLFLRILEVVRGKRSTNCPILKRLL